MLWRPTGELPSKKGSSGRQSRVSVQGETRARAPVSGKTAPLPGPGDVGSPVLVGRRDQMVYPGADIRIQDPPDSVYTGIYERVVQDLVHPQSPEV
jgi:hypothetical protein